MRAYIYARFSTLEQGKGSSLERQLTDCRLMCDRRGWDRSADRELKDEGRSAFHGANRAAGSGLADFEAAAASGALGNDVVLVCERLDRLSRQSVMEVFTLVSRLTELGVAVATVDGDRLYTKGSFDLPIIMELVVKAQLSHEESAKKSHRQSAAWDHKRKRAQSGDRRALTRQCPAWIGVDDATGEYVLRADRAEIVRRIFDLSISGLGKHMIASIFNREGIPNWSGRDRGWHPSYIQKILGMRAVLGEFQPRRLIAGQRRIEGEPILDLYPAVIDEVVFNRAQTQRASRTPMRGRRGKTLSNLFSRIARCGSCRSVMTFRNKGKPGEQYLVCDSALRRRGCKHRVYFNYPALEAGVIEHMLLYALVERHFAPTDEVHAADLACLNQQKTVDDLKARQTRLVDLLSRMENEEAERLLLAISIELEAATTDLTNLQRQRRTISGKGMPSVDLIRVRELAAALQSEDDAVRAPARALVQTALREIIGSFTCDPVALHTTVVWGHEIRFDRAGNLIADWFDPPWKLSAVLRETEGDPAAFGFPRSRAIALVELMERNQN